MPDRIYGFNEETAEPKPQSRIRKSDALFLTDPQVD
jgi:hypothetical protein